MKRKIVCSTLVLAVCLSAGFVRAQDNWPHWRGPHHNGISDSTSLPMKWSLTRFSSRSGQEVQILRGSGTSVMQKMHSLHAAPVVAAGPVYPI